MSQSNTQLSYGVRNDTYRFWQKKSIISENFIQGIFIIFITAA